jgi:LuxR family maltose regulon positive regulatory protein
MTTSEPMDPFGHRGAPPASVDPFLEAKLTPPPNRDSWVQRDRLIDAMDRAARHPVTLVAAPAGYGKTTLVAQWLNTRVGPAAAWISLDAGDNDPDRLWTHVAAALERAGCVLPISEPASVGRSSAPSRRALLPAIVSALAAVPDDLVLVLDDFHFIQQPACHEQVQFLISNLPAQGHLVIITRSDPGLRLGRLRASSDLAEIRAVDLSFTTPEAVELLANDNVQVSPETVTQLVERTEGWPAGLYLATLSLTGLPDADDFVRRFSGQNRFIGDYLTEEVLNRHTDRVRDFIVTVSILDRFSAPLCDHVAGISDSASILHELERSNLFVVPLDEERHWFRFHHLFAAVALSELELMPPGHLRSLHARAAVWFRSQGHVDEAIQHSLAAGDTETAASLVQASWLQYVDAGRAATVVGWLESLGPAALATGPETRVTFAWMSAFVGNEPALADHLAVLDDFGDHGPLPDGSRSVESAVAMIRGLFGYDGPTAMLAASQRAVELETDGHSPFYAIANAALGQANYVLGDLDRAVTALGAASRSDGAPKIIQVLSLSAESFVQAERGDVTRSRECAELAMTIVDARGMRVMPQASLAFAALGQAQAAAGKVDEALVTLELGLAMRRHSSAHGVWGPIIHFLVTAQVAAEAGRFQMARDLLAELAPRMGRFPDGMAAMHERVEAVHQKLREQSAAEILNEALTSRELDVLRLLQRGKSLQEIAVELYLSSNTVKTHARSLYRKLGAHSRAEALKVARRKSLI